MPGWRAALHRAAPALGLFAAARLTGMLVMALWAWHTGRSPRALLAMSWDSDWYLGIAAYGYGTTLYWPDGVVQSDLAFFPLYPALVRAVATVLPVAGGTAGLLVSWAAAGAAAWGVFLIGERLHGRGVATALVLLWGLLPHSIVLSMAYTEPLLTAFAAWSLYAVLRDRWVLAGALCVGAGLTRPSAAALVAALGVTALVTAVRERRVPVPMAVGVLLAPLGWLGYVVFVAVRQGSPTAYFEVQAAWGNSVDGGVALARFVWALLTGPVPLAGVGLCAALALVGWMVWLCVRQRQPLPVLVYTVAIVVVSLVGAAYFGSRPRLMMPAFPLLLPAAVVLARLRNRTLVAVLAVSALASGAYGAFTLLGAGPP